MSGTVLRRAVIIAAGQGKRLRPLTLSVPKSLVPVNGVPIVESAIRGLRANGITEIYIAVGYKKEQFAYLPEKYPGLTLVENPYFETANNISSVYVARAHLADAFILEADLLVQNPGVFDPRTERSGYLAFPGRGDGGEWGLTVENGVVTGCDPGEGGPGTHQLIGVSRWLAEDGRRLARLAEKEFMEKSNGDIYWDNLPLLLYPDRFTLDVREIAPGDVTEIDNFHDLAALDSSYARYLTE